MEEGNAIANFILHKTCNIWEGETREEYWDNTTVFDNENNRRTFVQVLASKSDCGVGETG